jgi:uncharacterized ubiquitin-like protein YukD
MLSPGFLGIYKTSPGRQLLIDLYTSTKKTSQFPTLVTNKIKVYNQDIMLSNEQKADLQKYVGQMTWSTFDSLVKEDKFNKLSDDEKLKVISNLMGQIGSESEVYIAKKLNIKKPTKAEEKAKESAVPKFKVAK